MFSLLCCAGNYQSVDDTHMLCCSLHLQISHWLSALWQRNATTINTATTNTTGGGKGRGDETGDKKEDKKKDYKNCIPDSKMAPINAMVIQPCLLNICIYNTNS